MVVLDIESQILSLCLIAFPRIWPKMKLQFYYIIHTTDELMKKIHCSPGWNREMYKKIGNVDILIFVVPALTQCAYISV